MEARPAEEVGSTQLEEMRRYFKESSIAEQCLGGESRSADGEEEDPVAIPEEDEKTDVMEMLNLAEHDAEMDENGGANVTPRDALVTVSAEREEGEVDEDIAKSINAELLNGDKEEEASADNSSAEEEDDDREEEEDEDDDDLEVNADETMEDSDPICSDDEGESSSELSSDEEDWRAGLMQCLNNQYGEKKPRANSTDDEDEEDKPLRTKNEDTSLPRVPKVEIQLQSHHMLNCVGRISSVMGLMVIVEGDKDHQALDEGSILWLPEKRIPLGFVDEVFGPVKQPFYVVRFNQVTEIPEEAQVSAPVAFVPDFAKTVLKTPNLYKKGYDASGLYDEELSEDEVDFSDDEKEAEFKREKNRAKRAQQGKEEGDYSQEKRTRNNGTAKGAHFKREPASRNTFRQGGGRRRDDRHADTMNVYQHVLPEAGTMGYTNSTTSAQTPPTYWPQQYLSPCAPNTAVLQQPQYQLPLPQAFQRFQGQQFPGMPYTTGYAFVPGQMAPPGFVQGMATVPSPVFMPCQTWWPPNETLQQQQQQQQQPTQQVQASPQQRSPSGNSDR